MRFGDPGWRLGYARGALSSFSGFRHLKADGVIPQHVRFQVCLPLPYSGTIGFFDEEDLERVVLIRQSTGTGTRDEVRRNLDAIAARGVKGVLYGSMGPDIPRELAAFAETALPR